MHQATTKCPEYKHPILIKLHDDERVEATTGTVFIDLHPETPGGKVKKMKVACPSCVATVSNFPL